MSLWCNVTVAPCARPPERRRPRRAISSTQSSQTRARRQAGDPVITVGRGERRTDDARVAKQSRRSTSPRGESSRFAPRCVTRWTSTSSSTATRAPWRSPKERSARRAGGPRICRWWSQPALAEASCSNGRLLDGATGNSGHVGHLNVVTNGALCSCGAYGCLEAEASGHAIEERTGRPAERGRSGDASANGTSSSDARWAR